MKKNDDYGLTQSLTEINGIYTRIKGDIERRLLEFRAVWENASEYDVLCELIFCLMTPQSKAKSCAAALEILRKEKLIEHGTAAEISSRINMVRFRNNKASYIVKARDMFSDNGRINVREKIIQNGSSRSMREWLVRNVTGMGYKEASHFLRNVGFGKDLAILDRHIIKNMLHYGIINEKFKTITPKNYIDLENKFMEFSLEVSIPADHLDFVFWYKEAGEVFK